VAIGPGQRLHRFSAIGIVAAPRTSGVYAICDEAGRFLHIGESDDIRASQLQRLADLGSCTMANGAATFAYEQLAGEERLERLDDLVRAHRPPCNPAAPRPGLGVPAHTRRPGHR
jgi:hypothetical protein